MYQLVAVFVLLELFISNKEPLRVGEQPLYNSLQAMLLFLR